MSVYGATLMDVSNVRRWMKKGKEDICCVVSEEIVEKIDNFICEYR